MLASQLWPVVLTFSAMAARTLEVPREALAYEMWMLHRTQEQISAWDAADFKKDNPDMGHLSHAVLESFLVHARSLLFFFFPSDDPHEDDLLPRDFLAGADWPHSRRTIPTKARQWIEDTNKALHHLSKERYRPRIVWDEMEIRTFIDTLFDEFNKMGPTGGPVPVEHPGNAT
jgi:hypothetical protein